MLNFRNTYQSFDVTFCRSNAAIFAASMRLSAALVQLSNLNGSRCWKSPVSIGLLLLWLLRLPALYMSVSARSSSESGFGGRYGSRRGARCFHNPSQSTLSKKALAFNLSIPAWPPAPRRSDGLRTYKIEGIVYPTKAGNRKTMC
jgi:hypothetical protein